MSCVDDTSQRDAAAGPEQPHGRLHRALERSGRSTREQRPPRHVAAVIRQARVLRGMWWRAAFAGSFDASPLQRDKPITAPNLASMNSTNTTPATTPRSSGKRFAVRMLHGLLAASLVSAAVLPDGARAAHSALGSKRFVYRADGKKLADVLQDFAASQSLPLVVDPGVDGVVNANFNTRPQEFLDAMTRTYGVIWYFDGTTLFIYPSRAMESKVFRMRGYDREHVRQMLAALRLGDARFPLRFDDANQTLLAYGPPRHIELVSTCSCAMRRRRTARSEIPSSPAWRARSTSCSPARTSRPPTVPRAPPTVASRRAA